MPQLQPGGQAVPVGLLAACRRAVPPVGTAGHLDSATFASHRYDCVDRSRTVGGGSARGGTGDHPTPGVGRDRHLPAATVAPADLTPVVDRRLVSCPQTVGALHLPAAVRPAVSAHSATNCVALATTAPTAVGGHVGLIHQRVRRDRRQAQPADRICPHSRDVTATRTDLRDVYVPSTAAACPFRRGRSPARPLGPAGAELYGMMCFSSSAASTAARAIRLITIRVLTSSCRVVMG